MTALLLAPVILIYSVSLWTGRSTDKAKLPMKNSTLGLLKQIVQRIDIDSVEEVYAKLFGVYLNCHWHIDSVVHVYTNIYCVYFIFNWRIDIDGVIYVYGNIFIFSSYFISHWRIDIDSVEYIYTNLFGVYLFVMDASTLTVLNMYIYKHICFCLGFFMDALILTVYMIDGKVIGILTYLGIVT